MGNATALKKGTYSEISESDWLMACRLKAMDSAAIDCARYL